MLRRALGETTADDDRAFRLTDAKHLVGKQADFRNLEVAQQRLAHGARLLAVQQRLRQHKAKDAAGLKILHHAP